LYELYASPVKANRALSIGVGSGIELEIIRKKALEIEAYDLSISEFVKAQNKNVSFFEQEFLKDKDRFDAVFAIELIEHVDSPYILLSNIYDSLCFGGKLVVTTATNVPQFDHSYNFLSHDEFEQNVHDIGFIVTHKTIIPHKYRFLKIEASNTFYILTKKDTPRIFPERISE